MRARLRSALAAILSLAVAAPAIGAGADELAEYRSLWEAAAVGAYEYGYDKYCECHPESPPETLVTVRGNEVVRVRHEVVGADGFVDAAPESLRWYWTIEGLFDLVEAAGAWAAVVRVDYDAELGYPTRVYVDYDPNLIGDELDVRLTRFTPLPE
ncbi:MAG TPA: DUF6174 domain-containing protein [Gammaproteobacteria bacterium]